jgi:DNA polymerase II small subunit
MESIIEAFSSHGTLVQPDSLNYILSKKNPMEFSQSIISNLQEYPLVLTTQLIKRIETELFENDTCINPEAINPSIQEINTNDHQDIQTSLLQKKKPIQQTKECAIPPNPRAPMISSPVTWNPIAKEYDADVKIINDITGNSTCEGTTKDFAKLFSDRFDTLRNHLRKQRRELMQAIPIKRAKRVGLSDIQLIGIVNEVRTTQNGHKLIELEDDSGTIACIALQNNQEVFSIAENIVNDEIIGVCGVLSKNGDLFIINNVIYPDISMHNRQHKSNAPLYAAFLSDIHIGSREFLNKEWIAFLRWINGESGNTRQKTVAGKIKYLVIPGDVVDGIGVYPNQEKELTIPDLYKQYEEIANQLQQIPEHIRIILQPGNHDAVRPAEPQPTFEKEIQTLFSGNDVTFIGNPSTFSLHTVEILSYHGQSLLDFATNIQQLKYNEPIEIMKVMLQKHHLAPLYGGYTPLAPEHKDYMIINQIPDIFVTGHVHLANIGEYRGVTLINASSWQDQTNYQKMLNFIPDPAKLPIVDLQSGNVTMMDFTKSL